METRLLSNPLTCILSFKSYYVVWKLYIYKIYIITDKGLNRTMQYGNTKYYIKKNKKLISLNRTMQYGNICRELQYRLFVLCLNRTMQYGNNYAVSVNNSFV